MPAATTGKQPKVHESLAKILSALSVAKGGTLPSNMGGKGYITAQDLSLEVKRLFVEHNLILLPKETIHDYAVVDANNRKTVNLIVTGEYTIVHTEDGSSVVVSGTGDGLATGTAVASNIASTNALKNALLRTFLVTEQSVEDAAKNGVESGNPQASGALATAQRQSPAKPASAQAAQSSQNAIKKQIQTDFIDAGKLTPEQVNVFFDEGKAKKLVGDAFWEYVRDQALAAVKKAES